MKHQSNEALLRSIIEEVRESVAPPPDLYIDEWCDRNLWVPAGAMPGRWDTDYVPFWRQPMRDMTSDAVEQVWVKASAQVGKTTMLQAIKSYFMKADPSPQMMVHSDENSLDDFMKHKLMPMIQATPVLRNTVQMPKPGKSGSDKRSLMYPGGFDLHVSANSGNSMRGRSVRFAGLDEIDAYKITSAEGSVIVRAFKRVSSYPNRKIYLSSTPTDETTSAIEKGFLEGDQQRWYVPCKDCNVFEPFKWSNVKWDKDAGGNYIPGSAHYVCEHCGSIHTDADKPAMNASGMWVATATPKDPKVRSYHINELASPWRTYEDVVRSFISAKDNPETLRAWVNTTLGEVWRNKAEQVKWEMVMERAEPYPVLRAPKGVRLITAGVDVQHGRIAVSIFGFGRKEESWLLFHTEIHAENGDVSQPDVWEKLDDLLARPIPSEHGVDLRIMNCAIDSSDGHKMHAVYNYCRGKRMRGIFPIKGSSITTAPVIGAGSKQDVNWQGRKYEKGVELYIVGTHVIKSTLMARLLNQTPGSAGYIHFPTAMGEDYFKQLCSEQYVTTVKKGIPQSEWVNDGRNESWDTAVYCYAAAYMAGLPSANWDKLDQLIAPDEVEAKKAEELATAPQPADPAAPTPAPAPQRKGPKVISSGWVGGFNKRY